MIMINKVKELCVVVSALIFVIVSSIAMAQDVITVAPYQDEFVIIADSGKHQGTGKLFYIPINPDGTFGTPSEVGDLGYRSGAGIADFDNDGDLDFVGGARDDVLPVAHFYLFENIGDGKFLKRWVASVDAGPLSDNKVGTFAVADFNGDGFKDFVVPIYQSDHVYLFANNGDKTFTVSELPPLLNPLDAKEGDFNEDGHMDFVITDYFNAKVYLYEGDGNGGFTVRALFNVPGSDRAADITVGDFNEDGHLDIIVDDFLDAGGGHIYFGYIEDGMAKFIYGGKAYSRPVLGDYSVFGVDSFDFDKDGHRDLTLSSYDVDTGPIFVMKGKGDGTFNTPALVASLSGTGFPVTPSQAPLLRINIDIKPGSDFNCFNQNGKGVIPVAIFGNAYLDVTQIDISSLALQGLSVKMAGKNNNYLGHYDYVYGDGYLDLIVQFQDSDEWISSDNGYAILTGKLYDGITIEGKDTICTVP